MNGINLSKLRWATKPLTLILSYGCWILLIRLLMLTLITFFMIPSNVRFQDISDAFSSNEVSIMGLGAIFYVLIIYLFKPITAVQRHELISIPHIQKQFLPGLFRGFFIASVIVFILSLCGLYQNLGYLILLREAPLEIGNTLLRMFILAAFVYVEEFIFRYQLIRKLQDEVPEPVAVVFVSVIFCLIKGLQFNLSVLHLTTLFLTSTALTYRVLSGEGFSKGAGTWAGILLTFHPLLSLPIFGNSFSGILLIKPVEGYRFLTGGLGGPLSSLGFQLLLILDITRSILRQRTLVLVKTNS